MTDDTNLSYYEKRQLYSIGNSVYGDGKSVYWWGLKSMPKLHAKGLVRPHPNDPRGWQITDAGRAKRLELFPNGVRP